MTVLIYKPASSGNLHLYYKSKIHLNEHLKGESGNITLRHF